MLLTKDHYISLKNGSFDTTSKADLDHLFTAIAADPHHDKLVVHFHGGLVNMQSGLDTTESIMNFYKDLPAYQVFFIWESGLLDVLSTNLNQIYKEPIFQRLLMYVTQFASAKVTQSAAPAVHGERIELPGEHEPFAAMKPIVISPGEQLQDAEKEQFQETLKNDPILQQESKAIANSLLTLEEPEEMRAHQGARGIQARGSNHTLMSPSALNGMLGGASEAGTQNIGTPSLLTIIEQSTGVLGRVIDRFAQRRDHGLYATIVEELLRQFYLDNVGKYIWDNIKQETINAFGDDPNNGGTAFLQGLKTLWESGQRPHITLVGHSAGAIYICEFLQQAGKYLPQEATLDIVLLAPACTFALFSETLQNSQQRITGIRVFGMEDKVEQADELVPLVYPHSLLYLVSGLFENEADTPLLGMQRYYTGEAPYNIQDVLPGFTYLSPAQLQRSVWSLFSGGDGLASDAKKHGDFYSDNSTLKSLEYILTNGFPRGS